MHTRPAGLSLRPQGRPGRDGDSPTSTRPPRLPGLVVGVLTPGALASTPRQPGARRGRGASWRGRGRGDAADNSPVGPGVVSPALGAWPGHPIKATGAAHVGAGSPGRGCQGSWARYVSWCPRRWLVTAMCAWERRVLPWALPVLLLALAAPWAAGTGALTYPWRDVETREWLVCSQCPPGTFVQQPCRRDSPTTCSACPPRHYTQFWNYLERCRYCNVICGEREEEARPCEPTHNRACRCRPGFFAHGGFCLEHEPCPPGSGVAVPGTPSQNTQCQPCGPGTFSARSSSSERCQPHRNCSALGLALNVPGSPSHDALCTSCMGFPLSTAEPGAPGAEECERALIDFVAFQDLSFKKFLRLWHALAGPEAPGPVPPREGRAELQLRLQRQLLELREARAGALVGRLLRALREARLPGLERSVRARFWAH
ncbi:tumor necrosis factor receptor superfamily member 6B [Vulpes vulpes]|uniref:Tumor necrosis factor receptor superfamily member 6B n=1 Tax=Vulpes vulpes TaxID=9627 RepID=A0ABM4YMF5_VULVU